MGFAQKLLFHAKVNKNIVLPKMSTQSTSQSLIESSDDNVELYTDVSGDKHGRKMKHILG